MTDKVFNGVSIREVWDFRLSTAMPLIERGKTWVVNIYAKAPLASEDGKPLESFDTGIPTEPGDEHDRKKIIPCFEWLYSVRDKYAHENIEDMKPLVEKINKANAALAQLGGV